MTAEPDHDEPSTLMFATRRLTIAADHAVTAKDRGDRHALMFRLGECDAYAQTLEHLTGADAMVIVQAAFRAALDRYARHLHPTNRGRCRLCDGTGTIDAGPIWTTCPCQAEAGA